MWCARRSRRRGHRRDRMHLSETCPPLPVARNVFACRRADRLRSRIPGVTVVPPGDAVARWWAATTRCSRRTGRLARCPGGAAAPGAGSTSARPPASSGRAARPGPPQAPGSASISPRAARPPARSRMLAGCALGLARYDDTPRRPRRRRHLPPLALPPLRLPVAARAARARGAEPRRRGLRAAALLARLPPPGPRRPAPTPRDATTARAATGGATTPSARGLAGGAHRLPDRRRRHAPAAAEGWMHNRARLIVASFLTKHLYVDWRVGRRALLRPARRRRHRQQHGNWQWVAGTGTDTRPNRVFNPVRQAGASIPRATTSAARCPSWQGSTAPACTSRGSWAACARAPTGARSSTTTRRYGASARPAAARCSTCVRS